MNFEQEIVAQLTTGWWMEGPTHPMGESLLYSFDFGWAKLVFKVWDSQGGQL